MLKTALIGSSGFAGSTLLGQTSFDDHYRSTNIAEIEGRHYELIVCAGAPAAKWKANQDPEGDRSNLDSLRGHLKAVRARRFLLISTVDVYPLPIGVDEASVIGTHTEAYGRNRFALERFATEQFGGGCQIVRLPGLFGRGLRKNFIFDLMENPGALRLTHCDSEFQFYDMSRLWNDLCVVLRSGIELMNFATAPVKAGDVAEAGFGMQFGNVTERPPVRYDMRTQHAARFTPNAQGPYLMSGEQVLHRIAVYARNMRGDAAA